LSNTEFFLDEEAESEVTLSDPDSNRVEYCNISANITARTLASFLQTLLQVYKLPSNENCILTLAVEAPFNHFNESKSALVEEFLHNILCLFELCFSQAGTEKHSQKLKSLEKAFAEKQCSSFHHCAIKWSWQRLFTNTASQSSEYNQACCSKCCCSKFFSASGLEVVIVVLLLKVLKRKVKVLKILVLVMRVISTISKTTLVG
jgi:hypothetical protein